MNCMSKGTQFARAGNLEKAQAVIKAYNRGNKKATAKTQTKVARDEFNSKMSALYTAFNNAKSDSEEEDEVLAMQGAAGGGGGGGAGSMPMPQRSSLSNAMKSKKKVTASRRMDDKSSAIMYQMSNQAGAYSKTFKR